MTPHSAPDLPHWTRGDSKTLDRNRVMELRGVLFRHPVRGTEREFIVAHMPDWVNVVAVTTAGRLVLVRQFRFGSEALSLEVPGGVMEKGEDPVTAGLRELREETGYGGGSARLLGSLHPNPSIQDNRVHVVLAEGVSRTLETEWDADEEISITTATVSEVLAAVRAGRITHSLTVAALALWPGAFAGPVV